MRGADHHANTPGRRHGRLPSAGVVVGVAALGAGLVIARRPDAVTNPQFWAEDGRYWFADAYNHGAQALLWSYQGYLVTIQRVVGWAASGLSLSHAAFVFNLVGIAIQVGPAAFFMSRRFAHVAPAWLRALIGLGYLLLPSFELNVQLTNAQWHLAILAVLVLAAAPAQGAAAKAFDILVLALSGLSGPFAVILLPAALARAATMPRRRRWYASLSGILLATLAVQGAALLLGHRGTVAQLGISFRNAVTIVADRVVLPGTFAEEGHAHVFTAGSAHALVLAALVTLVAIAVVLLALRHGGASLRVFVLACFAITGLSLLAPIATPPGLTAWTSLATSDGGERYFLTAEVAWFVCLVWAISRIPWRPITGAAGVALAAAFASGLVASWQYAPLTDLHPDLYTARLRAAPLGTTVVVPINPGEPWKVILVRH
jgi:hypothetical protein